MITVVRSHVFSAAHRLTGHPGACARIHGHAYRVDIEVGATDDGLDASGMVLDFGDVKKHLCAWLDAEWDHRLILWRDDPALDDAGLAWLEAFAPGSLWLSPFNPTAENMALHLLRDAFPGVLRANGLGDRCRVVSVTVYETEKCAARAVA